MIPSPGSADVALKTPPSGLGSQVRDLVSLTKPRLSALVLFTAGGGMLLPDVRLSLPQLAGSLAGIVAVVASANTLNNYLERDSDRAMSRTRNRALPAGRLAPRLALLQGLLLGALSLPLLALLANPLTAALAALSLFLYVCVYTPMKRRSALSTMVGAIPGAMPPLMGWTAATGHLDPGGLLLFAILFLWQVPHFLAIGLYRGGEYTAAGLKVHANTHGEQSTRRQIVLYLLLLLPVSLLAVPLGLGGMLTGAGALLLGLVFLWRGLEGLWTAAPTARWARRVFFTSLVYLTGLFAVLAVDRVW